MERIFFYQKVFDHIQKKIENSENRLLSTRRRNLLNSTDFSIISNNCWAGHVYRRYGLPYSSPTVGIYFYADEYIKFLNNLHECLDGDIIFISADESKYSDDLIKKGQKNVLVGKINNSVEVVFLHYYDKNVAIEKWKRRASRVNYDKLVIKFSEMNRCSERDIIDFVKLPYENKILLCSNARPEIPYCFAVKKYTRGHSVADDTTYYSSFFDVDEYFSKL